MKRNKYLTRALNTLGIELLDDTILTVKDLKFEQQEIDELLINAREAIESMKESILILEERSKTITTVINQVEVEEWQEINPRGKIFKL